MTGPPRGEGDPAAAERPPFGGRWSVLYAVVVVALAAEIVLMAWLTGAFR